MSARTWLCTWLSPAARASIAADSPAVDSRKLATISFAVTPGAVAPPLLPEKVVAHGPLCDHLTWRCAQLTLTLAGRGRCRGGHRASRTTAATALAPRSLSRIV